MPSTFTKELNDEQYRFVHNTLEDFSRRPFQSERSAIHLGTFESEVETTSFYFFEGGSVKLFSKPDSKNLIDLYHEKREGITRQVNALDLNKDNTKYPVPIHIKPTRITLAHPRGVKP